MFETSSILAIIPARTGSKGVPAKNLRHLAGKPLICYSCETALSSKLICRTIVSTDGPKIASIANSTGAETPFLRPTELASDTSPTVDTIEHTLNWLAENESWQPEYVVLLQPTAPLRVADDVDLALSKLLSSDADSIVSVCRVDAHFHPDWQFKIQSGTLTTIGGHPIGSIPTRRQALDATYVRNGAIYAFRCDSFRKTHSIYGDRCLPFEMPRHRSVNIDTMEDFLAAEAYLAQQR